MGKITIDELSNELKEYMNGLGLTEEQVNQLVENFSGNKTELLTTNKTDLVAAINELFQNANNGKELIATAIGEPLTAEDTFSAMSSGINNLNSQFKSALMTNGVSVESSDKFKQLIEKLSLIADSEGKGIQYASGSATSEILYSDVYGVKVDNLNFKPDIILIQANTYNGIIYNGLVSTTQYVSFSATSGKAFGELMNTYTYVNENRFSLKSPGIDDVNWYAIGVGEEDTTLEDTLRDILANKGVEVSAEDDLASLITKVDNIVPKGYELLPSWKKTTSYLNSWLIGEKYPYLVSGLNSAVVGNKIYCFGGKTRTGYNNKLLYYDTNDNTWTEKTGNLVYEGIGVASIDEKIYCFGGCDSGLASTSGYCYDTINDSWESIKGFGSGNKRSHMAIGVINNLIYIAGGDNGGAAYYATTYCYDPVVNTMTTKTYMTAQRCRLASSVLDNMLYCIGGYYDGNAYKTNYCYDPSTDTWTTKTSIPDVRRDLNSGVINGKIYCIGGSLQTVASSLDNNYCYDPSTNTWTTKKPIPTNRKTFALESVGNLIYCIGGHSGDQDYPVPTNEIYIPD